jgi:glucosamine-6-phosphate deaminase
METAFYNPLGNLTIPENQRNFATRENLPSYGEKIEQLKARGARLVTVFGIGRVFHIAFWEPHFAAEYASLEEWKKPTHRLGAKLHPLTIEQNALHSFKSRTTQVPCFANTIGPGLFLKSDKVIGGCDGAYERGMMWSGMSLWVALRYGPDMWVPASFMPTMPGKLFFFRDLAGPLTPECN